VLSRTPTLSDTVYSGILERLGGQGYDPKRLQKVPQKAAAPTFPVGQPKS
jgi:lipocalin